MSGPHASKVFSLIPFFCEAAITNKNFVLKMELYPKAEMLSFDLLQMDGVRTVYLPINTIIPITKYDYWAASWKYWTKQNQILDLDMILTSNQSPGGLTRPRILLLRLPCTLRNNNA